MMRRPALLRTRFPQRLRHFPFISRGSFVNNPILFKFIFIKGRATKNFFNDTEYTA